MMYDELVYHLDLCILAYHLHSQTLIWPMDPYYEQMAGKGLFGEERRQAFRQHVAAQFQRKPNCYGPGSIPGWPDNPLLDPIIADYRRIYPWRPSFTRPTREDEPWIVYQTPESIVNHIDTVKMVRYSSDPYPYIQNRQNVQIPQFMIDSIHNNRPAGIDHHRAATDLLYCFEGGTGAIGGAPDQKQYALWSMMGFVLARTVSRAELNIQDQTIPEPYDVHIVFRGSRSGKLRPTEFAWAEKGNPDWVTDGDLIQTVQDQEISRFGSVCRGFRTSIKTMLPTVVECLRGIHTVKQRPPRTIYVTGHSLGGALACHFTSAMVMGTTYGPYGTGQNMPDVLKAWPWRAMQLMTFSAPVVGDEKFKQSFDTTLASRRIWLNGDPVTQERLNKLVGQPYKITRRNQGKEQIVVISQSSHEPIEVRRCLIQDRRKNGFSMHNVPANTGTEDPKEPWKLFPTCQGMFTHLSTVRPGVPVRDYLPDFKNNLCLYLTVLSQAMDPEYKSSLDSILTSIKNINPSLLQSNINLLDEIWRGEGMRHIQLKHQILYKFFGLCFSLCLLSITRESFPQALPQYFKTILDSKF